MGNAEDIELMIRIMTMKIKFDRVNYKYEKVSVSPKSILKCCKEVDKLMVSYYKKHHTKKVKR